MKGGTNKVSKILRTQAFTIVELLIVIVVIGILAAIIIVGYGAVINNANDTSVKADLQKVDDAFKQFSLDNQGVFPDTAAELSTLNLKLNGNAYYTANKANIYVCTNANSTEYAVIAMSKSGKRFVVKSEAGISEYTGSVVWNATTANWDPTCASIDATYDSPANLTGLVGTAWSSWTGALDSIAKITNYATNPGVETNASGWNANFGTGSAGSAARTTTLSQSGTASHRLTWTTAPSSFSSGLWDSIDSSVPGAGGRTFRASVYVQASYAATVTLNIVPYTSAWVYTSGEVYSPTIVLTPNTWTLLTMVITPPAGTENFNNRVRSSSGLLPVAGSTLTTDSLMFTEGTTQYNYADGSSVNWAWTGATNNSTSTGPAL